MSHSDAHAVDGEQRQVVGVQREVVVLALPEGTTGLQSPRHVHDDACIPAVAVARHEPDHGGEDASTDRDDDRNPGALRPPRHPDEDGQGHEPESDGHDHLPAVLEVGRSRRDETDDGDRDERDPGQSKQYSTDRGLHGARRYPTGVGVRSGGQASRSARLTAETMALMEAVTIDGSTPTPQRTRSPTAHST